MGKPGASVSAVVTLRDVLAETASRFAAAAIETPQRDARLLVAAALGLTPVQLITEPEREVDAGARDRVDAHVRRRLAREPVARIVGERAFYGRSFMVTPAVLDPRPDTETLIDLALTLAAGPLAGRAPLKVLDIGTGSGAILLTLLAERPDTFGVGADISNTALEVAAANADRLGLGDRAHFLAADLRLGFTEAVGGSAPFDLVVSNPPYIPTAEVRDLQPEVSLYDPTIALDGGSDGLDAYRHIIAHVAGPGGVLAAGGWLVLELGAGQHRDVGSLLVAAPAIDAASLAWRNDIAGRVRCVAAMRKAN